MVSTSNHAKREQPAKIWILGFGLPIPRNWCRTSNFASIRVLVMNIQHRIRHRLFLPESVRYINGVLDTGDIPHRTALARHLCTHFNFSDARGRPQLATCQVALRALERSGQVARRRPAVTRVRQRDALRVASVCDVPARVDQLQGLALVMVSNRAQQAIWHGLMAHEHPLGAGPLVGRQMRYLLASDHGMARRDWRRRIGSPTRATGSLDGVGYKDTS